MGGFAQTRNIARDDDDVSQYDNMTEQSYTDMRVILISEEIFKSLHSIDYPQSVVKPMCIRIKQSKDARHRIYYVKEQTYLAFQYTLRAYATAGQFNLITTEMDNHDRCVTNDEMRKLRVNMTLSAQPTSKVNASSTEKSTEINAQNKSQADTFQHYSPGQPTTQFLSPIPERRTYELRTVVPAEQEGKLPAWQGVQLPALTKPILELQPIDRSHVPIILANDQARNTAPVNVSNLGNAQSLSMAMYTAMIQYLNDLNLLMSSPWEIIAVLHTKYGVSQQQVKPDSSGDQKIQTYAKTNKIDYNTLMYTSG